MRLVIVQGSPSRGHLYTKSNFIKRALSTGSERASDNRRIPIVRRHSANGRPQDRHAEKVADRDFFLSILDSSATKRDAKAYLKSFTPPANKSSELSPKYKQTIENRSQNAVNLGSLYGPTRAVSESPKFIQHPELGKITPSSINPLHIALVKLRAPQLLEDEALNGVGRTLCQLAKLGLTSVVVVDCNNGPVTSAEGKENDNINWKQKIIEQTERVAAAIEIHGRPGARIIDSAIGISTKDDGNVTSAAVSRKTQVVLRKLLMAPLRRGVIPVIPAIAYTNDTQHATSVDADDIVMALAREFAGFKAPPLPDEDPALVAETLQALRREVSLDRLIILDPLGGIPAIDRPNGYHVFLNMEQEYESIKNFLTAQPSQEFLIETTAAQVVSDVARNNPISRFVKTQFGGPVSDSASVAPPKVPEEISNKNQMQLKNLDLVRMILSILPSNSSALLTTPEEAANSGRQSKIPLAATGVGTRRKRNPLIHNLLTDKPVFSSSLPLGRILSTPIPGDTASEEASQPATRISPTTFAKRGMSVTIYPDPRISPWKPPAPNSPNLALTDPRIDLPRLVHLINDSFNRTLDVPAYLERVNSRIAGVIIAGEYEGGALLTWELPPGVPDDESEAARARMVPYLDKFAVLKRSQGSGGVADIVFKAMVRECFPNGVCWRSRKNNPVNKWYFERSRGTWKMPDTEWTMFWTTEGIEGDGKQFDDYESVCRTIGPTWADGKKIAD